MLSLSLSGRIRKSDDPNFDTVLFLHRYNLPVTPTIDSFTDLRGVPAARLQELALSQYAVPGKFGNALKPIGGLKYAGGYSLSGDFTIEFLLYVPLEAFQVDMQSQLADNSLISVGGLTSGLNIGVQKLSNALSVWVGSTVQRWTPPTRATWYHMVLQRSAGATQLIVNGATALTLTSMVGTATFGPDLFVGGADAASYDTGVPNAAIEQMRISAMARYPLGVSFEDAVAAPFASQFPGDSSIKFVALSEGVVGDTQHIASKTYTVDGKPLLNGIPLPGVAANTPSASLKRTDGEFRAIGIAGSVDFSPTTAEPCLTFDMYVYIDDLSRLATGFSNVFSYGVPGTSGSYFNVAYAGGAGTLANFGVYYYKSSAIPVCPGAITRLEANTWYHIAVTIEPGTGTSSIVSLYVDGKYVGSYVGSGFPLNSQAAINYCDSISYSQYTSFMGAHSRLRVTRSAKARFPHVYALPSAMEEYTNDALLPYSSCAGLTSADPSSISQVGALTAGWVSAGTAGYVTESNDSPIPGGKSFNFSTDLTKSCMIATPNIAEYNIEGRDFTVDMYIKPGTQASTGSCLFSSRTGSDEYTRLFLMANGTLQLWIKAFSTTASFIYSTATVVANSWNHVAVQHVMLPNYGHMITLWLNGVVVASGYAKHTSTFFLTRGALADGIQFGQAADYKRHYVGLMACPRVTLGKQRLGNSFNAPLPDTIDYETDSMRDSVKLFIRCDKGVRDETGRHTIITNNLNTSYYYAPGVVRCGGEIEKVYGASLKGIVGAYKSNIPFVDKDFTIEFKTVLYCNSGNEPVRSSYSGSANFMVCVHGAYGCLSFYARYTLSGTTYTVRYVGATTLDIGRLYDVAVCRKGNVLTLWVDGKLDGAFYVPAAFITSATDSVVLGSAALSSATILDLMISYEAKYSFDGEIPTAIPDALDRAVLSLPLTTEIYDEVYGNGDWTAGDGSQAYLEAGAGLGGSSALRLVGGNTNSFLKSSLLGAEANAWEDTCTFHAFIKMASVPSKATVLFSQRSGTARARVLINSTAAGAYSAGKLTLDYSGNTTFSISATVAWQANTWYSIRVGHYPGSIVLFVNDVPLAYVNENDNAPMQIHLNMGTSYAYVGSDDPAYIGTMAPFQGYVQGVRLYRGAAFRRDSVYEPPALDCVEALSYNGLPSTLIAASSFKDATMYRAPSVGATIANVSFITDGADRAAVFSAGRVKYAEPLNDWCLGEQDFTIEMVIKGGTDYHGATFLSCGNKSTGYVEIADSTGGVLAFSSTAPAIKISSTTKLPTYTQSFVNVTVVRQGTSLSLFINGVREAQTILAEGTNFMGTAKSAYLWYGLSLKDDSYFRYGVYKSCRISNGARYSDTFTPNLSKFECDDSTIHLCNFNDNAFDEAYHRVAMTLVSDKGQIVFNDLDPAPMSPYTFTFDGASAIPFENAALAFGTADFCIEAKIRADYRSSWAPTILSNAKKTSTASNAANLWALCVDSCASGLGKFTFWVNNSSTSTPVLTSKSSVRYGEWMHVMVLRRAGTMMLCVNGKVEATYSTAANLDGGTASPIRIGKGVEINSTFCGAIEDVRAAVGSSLYVSPLLLAPLKS